MPLITRVVSELGARVSVDTYKPAVAAAAIAAGASIVNDVSGLRDPELADVCAQTGAALVVMHTIAEPKRRLHDRAFDGLMAGEVRRFLEARIELAVGAGRRVRAVAARSRARLLQDAGADDRGAARAAGAGGDRPAGAAGGVTQGLHRRPDRAAARGSGWRARWRPSRTASAPARTCCGCTMSAAAREFLHVLRALDGSVDVDPGLQVVRRVCAGRRHGPASARRPALDDRVLAFWTQIAGRWPNATGANR